MNLFLETFASPVGGILLVSDGAALAALDFADYEARMLALLGRRFGPVDFTPGDPNGFAPKLARYFQGDLAALADIPVSLGGTEFQRGVWGALRAIPAGQSRSYAQLAGLAGRPAASRAVGMANSQNPVAIVLPCHRVIGANGALTGYAGGLRRKAWLLRHEGHPDFGRGVV